MNIEKNKTFLLALPEVGSCYGILISKNGKEYLLISQENKKLFKICLNAKNETEYYEKRIGLSDRLKEEIFKNLQDNVNYIKPPFNSDEFFVDIEPLQIPRAKMRYSLYVDGAEDYLTQYEWVGKTIEITSKYFDKEVRVFIYREKDILVYGILNNLQKIVKYVFKIENNILNLIKEERYNDYIPLNFVQLKEDFRNLTTTSHEMQRDISSKEENIIFSMKLFKKVFGIE